MGDEGVKTGKYLIKMSSFVLASIIATYSAIFIGNGLNGETNTAFRPAIVLVEPMLPPKNNSSLPLCNSYYFNSLIGMKGNNPYILENYPNAVFIDFSREKYLYDSNLYKIIISVKKDNDGIIREILCK